MYTHAHVRIHLNYAYMFIHVHVQLVCSTIALLQQVFVVDRKLFTLGFIDDSLKKLNLCSCDGDKPSPLTGISLTLPDSNLHQHGMCTSLVPRP